MRIFARKLCLTITCLLIALNGNSCFGDSPLDEKPNVIFISVDDLNDWVGVFGGHPQVKTPNIDRFANESSVVFRNAHCAGPVCGSSRSALLSGFMPSTSGIYGNGQNMLHSRLVQQHATLPEYFAKHGYHTLSAGKIFHRHFSENGFDSGQWAFEEWARVRGGTPVDKTKITSRNKNLIHGKPGPPPNFKSNGGKGTEFSWGPTTNTKEETKDYRTAKWAAHQLQKQHDKPFFMAVGLSRPHLPFYVPQEYFDLYDLKTFKAPEINENDLDDILVKGKDRPKHSATADYLWLKQNGLIDEVALAYAACCSYADDCLGVIFDELAKSPYKNNTIVIVWGDHGWHLGEKLRYRKTTGWSESTRVPLLVRMPVNGSTNNAAKSCERPVNLIDLYPTLIELCGLPEKPEIDGKSFVPLLKNPSLDWEPTLTVFGKGNASVQGERYHYIRYGDGTEEFYDLKSDPMEWKNLIKSLSPEEQRAREELSKLVPSEFTESIMGYGSKLDKKSIKNLDTTIKPTRVLSDLK